MNAFPVIHINLGDLYGETKDEMMLKFKDIISKIYTKFRPLVYNSLDEYAKQRYDSYMLKTCDLIIYTDAIYDLCYYLSLHYNSKCILLIDEYDTPLQVAFEKGYYEEVYSFLMHFFTKTLKSNHYLEKGVVCGIMETPKGSLFSGLNNIVVNSLLNSNRDEFFGFLEEDVKNLLQLYNKTDELKTIETWYGGYNFSGHKIYNGWSIFWFLKNCKYDLYLTNTASNTPISYIINNISSKLMDCFPELISGNTISHSIDYTLNYTNIKSSQNVVMTYLLFAGYLTIEDELFIGEYNLKFPNKEIKEIFKRMIICK